MTVICRIDNHGDEYPDVINSFYDLKRFDNGVRDVAIIQGYRLSRDENFHRTIDDIPYRAYLNLEAPTAFASTNNSIAEQQRFTHVYTLCPYSCDYANQLGDTKFIPIPFPYREDCFSPHDHSVKDLDAIYMGTAMNQEHIDIIESMKRYSYNFCSLGHWGNPTMRGVSSHEKWSVLARTKVSVAINMCPVYEMHKDWIRKNPNWDKIEAFNNLDYGYFPQFKPRVIEAARMKTLNLVKRDPWNVMEYWFEPDKHFVYWDTIEDLREKMNDAIVNFDKYQHIIDAAYKRVQDFEIDKIMDAMIKGDIVR